MHIRNFNRWQASASHLCFSLLLGLAVFALFRFLWYPDALFTLAGAGKLLLLVVGIDVVLGPLLTLVVFDQEKKSLIWDLAVIVAVQLGALGYGVWVMAQSRPVFVVAIVDRFEIVSANEVESYIDSAPEPFRKLSWSGPQLVGVQRPSDPQERLDIALAAASGGRDLHLHPKHYVAFDLIKNDFLREALPTERWHHLLDSNDLTQVDNLAAFPVHARFGWGTALLRPESGKIIRYADADLQSED